MSAIIVSTLVCVGSQALAQLDPLLIAPSSGTKPNPEEVDSRYTIRNRPSPVPSVMASPTPTAMVTPTPAPAILPTKKAAAHKTFRLEEKPIAPKPVPVIGDIENDEYADIPYDISKNYLELKTETFLVYNDSKTDYGYRSYNTFSQGLGLAVDVWFQKNIGIETIYRTTINAHTNGVDSTTHLKHTERWFDFMVQIRSEAEFLKTPFFVTKIGVANYEKKMPVDNNERATLDTFGPKLEFEVFYPTKNTNIWNFGFKVKPFQKHKEKAVGSNLASGDNPKTWGFGLSFGNRTIFSRRNQFYWKFEYELEKTLFSGDTQQVDPWTGTTLSDVPLKNSFLFFTLGFIWGG